MSYIYDICLNFQKRDVEFYDWNLSDNIYHLRKIPIFKVDNKTYFEIKENEVVFSEDLLLKIQNRTEVFGNKKVRYLKFACLISNGKDAFAILINDKESKRSSIMMEDMNDILEICNRIYPTKINYSILRKREKCNFKTRREEDMEQYLNQAIDKLLKEKDSSKLEYLYYECFDKKESNETNMIVQIKREIKNNFDEVANKLYTFFKLTEVKK